MTGNTSATGGFLAPIPVPSSVGNVEDDDLGDLMQELVVGITGLDGTTVFPRWQADQPDEPDAETTWCGVGVTNSEPEGGVVVRHMPDGDGYDLLERDEILTVIASFYGPGGQGAAGLLRDGLSIPQNRETLFRANTGFVDVMAAVTTADFANNVWRRRTDLTFRIRRRVRRVYPVLNVLEAKGETLAETIDQAWTAGPGTP